ncbi:MAG: NAD-dependent deacylase [Desulfobacterales bacterium]
MNLGDIEKAARIMVEASYAVALTGAGISVESGIPPFRGPGGIWTRYGEPPMDGYQRFLENPKETWENRLNPKGPMVEFVNALKNAVPNAGHLALAELEEIGIIKSVITQNIDNLHWEACSRKVIEIHGNAMRLRCIGCGRRYDPEDIATDQLPPACPGCRGILKSDTVFFGEPIPPDTLAACDAEAAKCDCMVVVGTSATVYPAAAFPRKILRSGKPVIEINADESGLTPHCRVSLRGSAGIILPAIVEAVELL